MRRQIYNWERWFSGQRFSLRKDVDYSCSDMTMAQHIRNQAHQRNKYVSIVGTPTGITVMVYDEKLKERLKRSREAASA